MEIDRRSYLAAVGTTALAGCLGGPDGGSNGDGGETVDSLPAPVAGDPGSDVTVMVFSDFACPHCARFEAEVLPRIESEYVEPGRIRYEHRDFPIPVDEEWSWAVANAARSVQDAAGDDAFFSYAKACFENQSSYDYDLLGSLAREVDVDGDRTVSDARDGTYRPVIEADRSLGVDLDLEGTPQVYVDRERLSNASYAAVSAAIDAEL